MSESANPVQEAWLTLAERCWWRSRTDDRDQDHVGAEKQAARALVVAVLDRAENSGCIYPYCEHPCEDCPLSALRGQIEALGR